MTLGMRCGGSSKLKILISGMDNWNGQGALYYIKDKGTDHD